MLRFRPHPLAFAVLLSALAACSGGGATLTSPTPTASPSPAPSCGPEVALYVLVTDLMTQPAAGAVGVSTTVGSITVPRADHVLGATLQLNSLSVPFTMGGTFTANADGSLTATVPTLKPNTTYHAGAVGAPCGPDFDFGQFTTGAT